MTKPILALGWKDLNANPKVLYYGEDPNEAQIALDSAIEKGQVVCGTVVQYWNQYACAIREAPVFV
jgi:hypothetical protein